MKRRVLTLVTAAIFELYLGTVYVWSVFHEPVVDFYRWTHAASSVMFSIMLPMNVGGTIAGGFICDRKGPRFVIHLGSALIVGGLLLSGLVPPSAPHLLYLTYAGMVGFGCGSCYNALTSIVQKWWADRKGFASGIFCCSVGLSTVVFAPLISALIAGIGVRNTFFALAAIFLCLLAMVYPFTVYPTDDYVRARKAEAKYAFNGAELSPGEMLRHKRCYKILLFNLCITPAYLMINPMIVSYGVSKGLSEQMALACVMVTGIASAAGRLTLCWLADRVRAEKILFALYAATVAAEALMLDSGGALYMLLIAVISFGYGGSAGLMPVMVGNAFGMKHLSANISVMMVSVLLGGMIYPSLGGMVSVNGLPGVLSCAIPAAIGIAGMVFMLATGEVFSGRSHHERS